MWPKQIKQKWWRAIEQYKPALNLHPNRADENEGVCMECARQHPGQRDQNKANDEGVCMDCSGQHPGQVFLQIVLDDAPVNVTTTKQMKAVAHNQTVQASA